MFLKNCWYVAAWDHELLGGRMLPRTTQQKVLDADPEFELQMVVADAALAHFRRTFANLVVQEQAEQATQQAATTAARKVNQLGIA